MIKLNPLLLRKTADTFNRKKYKRETKDTVKQILKRVKILAKKGKTTDVLNASDSAHGISTFIAFRWIRRYSGLDVKITEETTTVSKYRYIDKMCMQINW